MTLREEFCRADEEPLLDEKITRLFLGDTDEVSHDVRDEAELLAAVVPLTTDVDHPEGLGILPAVEPVDHEVQPSDRLPVVVAQHEVRLIILVDGAQLAQSVEDFLVVRQRDRFVVELVLRTREDLFGDGRLFVGHIRTLSALGDIVHDVNYQFKHRNLLQSDLLTSKLLTARTCIMSYEHRIGDF